MIADINTGLPVGTYCDVISGDGTRSFCTGRMIRVGQDGRAQIDVPHWLEDPMVALYEGSRVSDSPSHGLSDGQADYRRTVILIEKQTLPGQDLFMRGGIDQGRRPSCKLDPEECGIPITPHNATSGSHYDKFNAWRQGDTKLDWHGCESEQGLYQGQPAQGSPLIWTTNDPASSAYHRLNRYGDHYWLMDVNMDCSKTENGWFEVKAVLTHSSGSDVIWEKNLLHVDPHLEGTANKTLPFCSFNHIVLCGQINVIHFEDTAIRIDLY